MGFLSNPGDFAAMSGKKNQNKIAEDIFNAFCRYKTQWDAEVPHAGTKQGTEAPKQTTEAPKQTTAPKPATPKAGSLVVPKAGFIIQLTAVRNPLKETHPIVAEAKAVYYKDNGMYKYYIGTFTTREDADKRLVEVRKKFPEAFIKTIQ